MISSEELPNTNSDEFSLAVDLVETNFSRCVNYPRNGKGISGMAHGLMRASEITGVSMSAIAERCAETSERCPTNHELIQAGEAIRPPAAANEYKPPDTKERVPEAEFRKIAAGIDWDKVQRTKERWERESKAIEKELRKLEKYARMPTWRLWAFAPARLIAEIKQRLGFELNRWDKENLPR